MSLEFAPGLLAPRKAHAPGALIIVVTVARRVLAKAVKEGMEGVRQSTGDSAAAVITVALEDARWEVFGNVLGKAGT